MKIKKLTAGILAGAMMLAVALTGCGNSIDPNVTGATLDGKEISLGFMNFMTKYQQAIYDLNYSAYFGADMWSTEVEEGKNMFDGVKSDVANNIETLYLLESHMADYGVTITDEEISKTQEAAAAFMNDNSKKAIKQMVATQEYVAEMLRLYTIQNKMVDAIYGEVDTNVSDEEAAQRTFSYIRAKVESGVDEEGNTVTYEEGDKTALRKKMEQLVKDPSDDFTALAEEDDNLYAGTYSYGADEESMDEAVIAAADALKEGEVSELITTDTFYYIIRLDSEFDKEATEKKKESIISQRKSDHYTEVCDAYKEAAEFTLNESEWNKVVFEKMFTTVAEEE